MSAWKEVLMEPAKLILAQIGTFAVNVLLVLVILLIGWIISRIIRAVVVKLLQVVKFDDLADRIELDKLLEKGGMTYKVSELIGAICYWLAMLVTFMVAINAVGLTIVAELLNQIVLYIPNVIAAIFIIILGMFVATLLKNIVEVASGNAGISQGKLLAKIVQIIITGFVFFVALEQLKIGLRITELTIAIILGTIGLGVGLAFGLGCKDIVHEYVKELLKKVKSKE